MQIVDGSVDLDAAVRVGGRPCPRLYATVVFLSVIQS